MKLTHSLLFLCLSIFSSTNTDSTIIVGAQFGDEGKGKVIDYFSQNADFVIRAQGGNNAGHTIRDGTTTYKFHLIPSGILYPQCQCYLGGGVVIDPRVLLREIHDLEKQGIGVRGRLWISPYAHVIMPYHPIIDALQEKGKGTKAVGTTKRGIGPCYADKANRIGIQIADLINPTRFATRLESIAPSINKHLQALGSTTVCSEDEIAHLYQAYAQELQPYVRYDMESTIYDALQKNKTIYLEGAQGTFLDVTFGTVPFVTSSSTIAAGICAGAGIGPTCIQNTIAVAKTYMTRVGSGILPTEVTDEECFLDHTGALEFGTTTNSQRRVGWFDAVLARTSIQLNGANSLALTKLDILDTVQTIKICVAYSCNGVQYTYFPTHLDLDTIEPLYEELPGWLEPTGYITSYEDLPRNAQRYCERISELCACPISLISVGPERTQTIRL